jgi:uncharacterized protein YndB with AHSA1/START domain/predicted SnoaL-like aldol condensation-catalyzing enzyme
LSSPAAASVRITQLLEASAERVFDGWLDPRSAGKWLFAAPNGTMVFCEIDPRVGGRFRLVDRRDGTDFEHTGAYAEIARPCRLVFTFSDFFFKDTLVTVTIVPRGSGCELTLLHEHVPGDAARETESGWTEIVAGLARTISRKAAAVSFMRLVGAGKVREAYNVHVGPGFRHHNPYFAGSAEALRAGMEENAVRSPDKILEVKRVLEDGDFVAIHSHVRQAPGQPGAALAHIFRFEGERFVELWDIGQPVPETSVNENGMF